MVISRLSAGTCPHVQPSQIFTSTLDYLAALFIDFPRMYLPKYRNIFRWRVLCFKLSVLLYFISLEKSKDPSTLCSIWNWWRWRSFGHAVREWSWCKFSWLCMFYSTLSLVFCQKNSRCLGISFFPKTTLNLLMCCKNASGEGKTYSETRKTMNTKNISGMLLSCKRKTNQGWEN